jgi:hypothetical protein
LPLRQAHASAAAGNARAVSRVGAPAAKLPVFAGLRVGRGVTSVRRSVVRGACRATGAVRVMAAGSGDEIRCVSRPRGPQQRRSSARAVDLE